MDGRADVVFAFVFVFIFVFGFVSQGKGVMDGWGDGEPDTGLSLLSRQLLLNGEKISNGKDLLQSGAPLPKDGTQNRGRRVKPQRVELHKFRFLAYRSSWTHPFQYGNLLMR